MFGEFAIDPSLFADEAIANLLIGQLDQNSGRFVSDYPRHWLSDVKSEINNSNLGDVRKKSLKNRIVKSIRDSVRENPYRPRARGEWRPSVISEHVSRPFTAIVSETDDDGMHGIETVQNSDCDQWFVPPGQMVRRLATDIANSLVPLMTMSTQLAIVDPYFLLVGPQGDFGRVLAEILGRLANFTRLNALTIHTAQQDAANARRLLTDLPTPVPHHLRVYWQTWPKADLHDRYMVADVGAVSLGHGFAERRRETGAATDYVHVQRIDAELARDLKATYLTSPQATLISS